MSKVAATEAAEAPLTRGGTIPRPSHRGFVAIIACAWTMNGCDATNGAARGRTSPSGGTAPLYSPGGLREALLSFETRLGTPVQALSLRILPDRALLQATPGAAPDVVDQYEFIGGHVLGPTRVTLNGTGELEDNLFRLRSVQLEKLPSLVEEVTRASNGAHVTLVTIKRDLPQSGETRFALSLSGNGPDQVVLANRHGAVLRGTAPTAE